MMDDQFQEPEIETSPHNLDAEQAFLGALLVENRVLDEVEWLTADHFYDPLHGRIFATVQGRIQSGKLADFVTLNTAMSQDPGLAELGGAAYLALLQECAADRRSAPEYAKTIHECHQRRELCRIGADLDRMAAAGEDAPQAIQEYAERELATLTDATEGEAQYSFSEALKAALSRPRSFVQTGLTEVDENRMYAPGLIIVAGRSSMGKSALLLDNAYRAAAKDQASLILSNEMSADEISLRLAAKYTGIAYFRAIKGDLDAKDKEDLAKACEEVERLPLTIWECAGVSISGLRARIRRWKRTQLKAGKKIGLVAIDYLQNIPAEGSSLYERTSNVALGLQTLQLSLAVTVAVGCQIARAAESEKDKRPSLRHLRDSGKIEEVADRVALVYRDAYYAEREPAEDDAEKEFKRRERANSKVVEVDLAKNRQGPIGKFELIGTMATNHFEDMR